MKGKSKLKKSLKTKQAKVQNVRRLLLFFNNGIFLNSLQLLFIDIFNFSSTNIILILFLIAMLKEIAANDNNFIERNNYNYQVISIKIHHLSQENSNLRQYLSHLEKQLQSLRLINHQILNQSPRNVQTLLQELTRQNTQLQKQILRITKNNQELSSDVLMKSQIIIQNQNQFRQILNNYQNKIFQLRTNLQAKQSFMAGIQNKKMAEKCEIINPPSRTNILCLNEINQLRLLNERYHIQNVTLQLLATSKNQQLEQTKRKLKMCEQALKKGQSWSSYNNNLINTTQLQKTKQKSTYKLKLEQQLLRYDNKYKQISSQYNKKNNTTAENSNLKLLVFELYSYIQKLEERKQKLQKMSSNKDKDLHQIKIAYRQLEMEMNNQRVEVDFYKQNFKELTKVTNQQKVKYYKDYYRQDLPLVKKHCNNLQLIVSTWKQQQKQNSSQRRILSKFIKKTEIKRKIRSLSCIAKTNKQEYQQKKNCSDLKKQNSILSFINQNHDLSSFIDYIHGQTKQNVQTKETKQQQNISFGEISEIEKAVKSFEKFNKKDRKQFFLRQEL